MKKIILFGLLVYHGLLCGQIVITSNDMPNPGDTIRISTATNLFGLDYTSTGEDYSWDFSSLNSLVQRVDTFVNVTETPLFYQIVFLPVLVANLATPVGNFELIPNFEVTDMYRYFKNSNAAYADIGFAFTFNNIPIPVKYDSLDINYKFPLNYGDSYQSEAEFDMEIPLIGYYSTLKSRTTIVDGWGTLLTPFGQFQTLRLFSEIIEYDSIYIDSLGIGFPVNRTIKEYKWLAPGFGMPVLMITEEGFIKSAYYIDSLRTNAIIHESPIDKQQIMVYPNPCSEILNLSFELMDEAFVSVLLIDNTGKNMKMLFHSKLGKGRYEKQFSLFEHGFSQGLYLLQIKADDHFVIRKILIK